MGHLLVTLFFIGLIISIAIFVFQFGLMLAMGLLSLIGASIAVIINLFKRNK